MHRLSWHTLHCSEPGCPVRALQVRRNSSKLLTPAPAVGLLSRALRSSLGVRAVSLHNLLDQAPSLESQLVRSGPVHARGCTWGKAATPAGAFPAEIACVGLCCSLHGLGAPAGACPLAGEPAGIGLHANCQRMVVVGTICCLPQASTGTTTASLSPLSEAGGSSSAAQQLIQQPHRRDTS